MSRNKPGEDEATETYAQAAQRLLRVLEQRAKKASGGLNQPEQIHEPGSVRRVPANDDREKRVPQLGGVSRGTRSYLLREGVDSMEGNRVRDEANRVSNHVPDTASSDRHVPSPDETAGPKISKNCRGNGVLRSGDW